MQEKIRKGGQRRKKQLNRRVGYSNKQLHTHSATLYQCVSSSEKQKSQTFQPFRIKIKEKERINHQFLQFVVNLKKAVHSEGRTNFLRFRNNGIVDKVKGDSKHTLVDQTNHDSEINSHSLGIQNSHSRPKFHSGYKSSNNFLQFFRHRQQLTHHAVAHIRKNTSCLSLKELINELHNRNMLSKAVFYRYLLHYSDKLQTFCLDQIQTSEEQRLNFKGCLFFLIDHRLFSSILADRFPEEYQMVTSATTFSKAANQYLKEIYSIGKLEYYQRIREFNQRYERFWLPNPETIEKTCEVRLNYEDKIEELNRMNNFGRILRRKV